MDNFFTPESLATLAGSTGITLVVINAIRHVSGWGPRWFGLLVAIIVAYVGLFVTAGVGSGAPITSISFVQYFIAFLNGCLIYTSAFGIQSTMVAEKPGLSFQAVRKVSKLTFRSPW